MYLRRDHLNDHMKNEHNMETEGCGHFESPFDCEKVHCRTMVSLLGHCEKEYKEKLGKD